MTIDNDYKKSVKDIINNIDSKVMSVEVKKTIMSIVNSQGMNSISTFKMYMDNDEDDEEFNDISEWCEALYPVVAKIFSYYESKNRRKKK